MRSIIIPFLVLFMSCASSKNKVTPIQIETLKELVATKNIKAEFDSANPLSFNIVQGIERLLPPGSAPGAINLIGNPNFFKIKKDSVFIDMPYFGERQLSGGYNAENGIKFSGIPKKEIITYNTKKQAFILKYWLQAKSESYTVILTLFANKNAILDVNSSYRTNIDYRGNWQALEEKEQRNVVVSKAE